MPKFPANNPYLYSPTKISAGLKPYKQQFSRKKEDIFIPVRISFSSSCRPCRTASRFSHLSPDLHPWGSHHP